MCERIYETTGFEAIPHPEYNDISKKNDIALLRLEKLSQFPPVLLATEIQAASVKPGKEVLNIGWGFNPNEVRLYYSPFLHKANFSIGPTWRWIGDPDPTKVSFNIEKSSRTPHNLYFLLFIFVSCCFITDLLQGQLREGLLWGLGRPLHHALRRLLGPRRRPQLHEADLLLR